MTYLLARMMRRTLLGLSLLLSAILPLHGEAAVSIVGTCGTGTASTSTTLTISRTVSAGSNRALTFHVAWHGTETISSVVFNTSETMTVVGTATDTTEQAALYILVAPSVTTANAVVTFSSATSSAGAVCEWNNVDQATPTHGVATAMGDNATVTVTVASVISGEVTVDSAKIVTGPPTVGAGQTQDLNTVIVGASYAAASHDTTGTGSVVMSWSHTSDPFATVAAALKESAGGGGVTPHNLMLMGVGQ